jgi:hypothetical protein
MRECGGLCPPAQLQLLLVTVLGDIVTKKNVVQSTKIVNNNNMEFMK